MTGGTMEIREEGMLLRLPDDRLTTSAATPAFPVAAAPAWFALNILDAATTEAEPDQIGRVTLTGAQIDAVAARVYADNSLPGARPAAYSRGSGGSTGGTGRVPVRDQRPGQRDEPGAAAAYCRRADGRRCQALPLNAYERGGGRGQRQCGRAQPARQGRRRAGSPHPGGTGDHR